MENCTLYYIFTFDVTGKNNHRGKLGSALVETIESTNSTSNPFGTYSIMLYSNGINWNIRKIGFFRRLFRQTWSRLCLYLLFSSSKPSHLETSYSNSYWETNRRMETLLKLEVHLELNDWTTYPIPARIKYCICGSSMATHSFAAISIML